MDDDRPSPDLLHSGFLQEIQHAAFAQSNFGELSCRMHGSGTVEEHMMNAYPVNLAPLYHRCIFKSASRVDFHEETARELAEHRLRWREGDADTVLHKANLGAIEVYGLRYGAEVEVTPRPSNDFVVVHWGLRGLVEMVCDGQRAILLPGQTAWISPRRSWNMRWQAGSEQLILKVPKSLVSGGRRNGSLPSFGMLPALFEIQWLALVQMLLSAVTGPTRKDGYDEWIVQLERLVVDFLLIGVGGAGSGRHLSETQTTSAHEPITSKPQRLPIERLENAIADRLGAQWSINDLADAAGVSPRALQMICQRERDISPTDLLRNMRLDAAHRRLKTSSFVSVTETALELGFGHLGRFSSYYRERFGELPSETCTRRNAKAVSRTPK
ncbi:AraC family transcriptional regulator [Caballeronia novacaledonica]|uniref:AraC family transcriptional regulator n=1 Tax=Caballeronia novacaledonica TaxID=1544861 RepID=A0ACB5R2X1_9BURK|nr:MULTISPECIES: AraC family transcriptional regulator [Caballeronia]GJH13101.1 AraC family transcriptional regulator [Caballeronia novacaledonica]GJH21445.1 AraC family transcriptional regulator [Caballeronia novacaledonica]